MAKNDQEIEIKFKLKSTALIVKKLKSSQAKNLGSFSQTDILWDYLDKSKTFSDFDHSLRLRIETSRRITKNILTFKGTPLVENGKKIRDEFNSEIKDPKSLRKILSSIGFFEAMEIKKKRTLYEIDGVEISIDEIKFGNFLELEGPKEKIDNLIKKLNLKNLKVVLRPYYTLQLEWERKN